LSEIELRATTLSDLLEGLKERFGRKMASALGPKGSERDRIVVLVNGRNTGGLPVEEVRFKDGDDVAVFPPVSGG
jgi:MoaD family protein